MKLCATLAKWETTKWEVVGGLIVHFINALILLRHPFDSNKNQQRLFDKVTKYPSFCFHAKPAFSTYTCTLLRNQKGPFWFFSSNMTNVLFISIAIVHDFVGCVTFSLSDMQLSH